MFWILAMLGVLQAEADWFPPVATNLAKELDKLTQFLVVVSAIAVLFVIGGFVYFAIRFKRISDNDKTPHITHNHFLEFLWSFIPFVIFMFIFAWGWYLYSKMRVPASGGQVLEVHVYGQMWNWDFVYKNGRKSAGVLYVPKGRSVKLIMTSRDVIHSFYVPAFRIKQDVLPGTYTALFFKAQKKGKFYVFCTEFCGAGHSKMQARVHVMETTEWEKWLLHDPYKGMSMVQIGKKVFQGRCTVCHTTTNKRKIGPGLKGLFGAKRYFQDGTSRVADENYIRESILNPSELVVKDFPNQMTPFAGLLKEEELTGLIEYIKSLKDNKDSKTNNEKKQ